MKKRNILVISIILTALILTFGSSYAWEIHEDSFPRYTIGEEPIIEYIEICIVSENQYICRNIGDFENTVLGIRCRYDLFGQKNSYAEDADIAELDFSCIVEKEYEAVCPISMKLGEWPKRRLNDKSEEEIIGELEQSTAVGIVGGGRGIVFVKPEGYHFRIEDLKSGVTFRLCSNKAPPGKYDTSLFFVPISTEISKDALHDPLIDLETPPDTLEIVPENGVDWEVTQPDSGGRGIRDYIRDYWMWVFVITLFVIFLIVFLSAFTHMFKRSKKTEDKDREEDDE